MTKSSLFGTWSERSGEKYIGKVRNTVQNALVAGLSLGTPGAKSCCGTREDCIEFDSELWYLRSEEARVLIYQTPSVID